MTERERYKKLLFASLMEDIGKSCNIDKRFADHLLAIFHLYFDDKEAEKALERSRG